MAGAARGIGVSGSPEGAARRLEACPAELGGVAVGRLRDEVSAWVKAMEDGGVPGRVARIRVAG